MSRQWYIWVVLAGALALLSGCEVATPPPLDTPVVQVHPTPSPPIVPTETPVPWPADRFVFPYLDKIWIAEGTPPYVVTVGQHPALSPDGQRIAYLLPVSGTAGLTQVYVVHLDSGQIFLLSGPPAAYTPPVWSPDNQYVAYTVDTALVVTDPQGQFPRVLANDVGAVGEGRITPVWSADGQTIVCPLTRLGAPELFALRLADGQAAQLSYTGGYPAAAPFVVLYRDTVVGPKDMVVMDNLADGGTLWGVRLDGSERQRLLPELDGVVGPMCLSADGARLAGLRQIGGGYSLWALDLVLGKISTAATLERPPDLLRWSRDGQTLYWLSQTTIYRYDVPAGQGQAIASLPAATPLPTITPLPVESDLFYYADGAFYRARAYASPQRDKEIPTSLAVLGGYSLRNGIVAFPRQADIYLLQMKGGTPRRLYTFQEEKLVLIELVWSLQGNALLYTATYDAPEGTAFGRRVDIGLLRLKPGTQELLEMRRFTSLMDRSGATPLLYDEERGQAIVVPWSGDLTFNRLDVYDVNSGVEVAFLAVEGYGAAAVSADWRWAAAAGYDAAGGRGFIRRYDLAAGDNVFETYLLPEGTFCRGPLRWSPDSRYVAFIPLIGNPEEGAEGALGIWVLRAETLEANPVVSLEDPRIYLVGWDSPR